MEHEIDLKNVNLYTDLAIEQIDSNIKVTKYKKNNIKVTNVLLDKDMENKKKGNYITIEFDDCTDKKNKKNITKVLIQEIKKIIKNYSLYLIIGLGNSKSTPDSLGPKVIDNILVTNHLYELNSLSSDYKRVCAIKTSVMANTGIESYDIIKSITSVIKPDCIIVIDSLAARSIERLNKTIQITDSGINPGSGIGNNRKEISFNTLNIPVIAIGVTTVVSLSNILVDTSNYLFKYYDYIYSIKDKNKLVTSIPNYLKYNIKTNKQVFGLLNKLDDEEKRVLFNNVLNPIGYNLLVTDKDIDFQIDKLSSIISDSINMSLHNYSTK